MMYKEQAYVPHQPEHHHHHHGRPSRHSPKRSPGVGQGRQIVGTAAVDERIHDNPMFEMDMRTATYKQQQQQAHHQHHHHDEHHLDNLDLDSTTWHSGARRTTARRVSRQPKAIAVMPLCSNPHHQARARRTSLPSSPTQSSGYSVVSSLNSQASVVSDPSHYRRHHHRPSTRSTTRSTATTTTTTTNHYPSLGGPTRSRMVRSQSPSDRKGRHGRRRCVKPFGVERINGKVSPIVDVKIHHHHHKNNHHHGGTRVPDFDLTPHHQQQKQQQHYYRKNHGGGAKKSPTRTKSLEQPMTTRSMQQQHPTTTKRTVLKTETVVTPSGEHHHHHHHHHHYYHHAPPPAQNNNKCTNNNKHGKRSPTGDRQQRRRRSIPKNLFFGKNKQ